MSVTIYDRYNRPVGEQLEFHDVSLTEQHHKDDCDVNQILNRYLKTGVLESSNRKVPLYGDFTGTPDDYRGAVELLHDARDRFDTLPSAVRERFDNDPLKILEFLNDPANRDEAVRLGLVSASSVKSDDAPNGAGNENNREAVTGEAGEGA